MENITGIILAGGKSSRMGVNKANIPFMGKKLLEHGLELLQAFCTEVMISSNNATYTKYGVSVVPDNYDSIGPMGGLEACLKQSKTDHNIFISCDIPFVNMGMLYKLLEHATPENQVVAYRNNNLVEPLIACYSKQLLPLIDQLITAGRYSLLELMHEKHTHFIDAKSNILFKNLNAPKDFEQDSVPFKYKYPNMVLVAGDGRNVGKTHLACSIIERLALVTEVTGIKICPHFHELNGDEDIIARSDNYIVIGENKQNHKDSSRMLQAGAKRVYYIISKKEHLHKAFEVISETLHKGAVVVESGGLNEFAVPGLFLFVKNHTGSERKPQYLKYNPILVHNSMQTLDFNIEGIAFNNKHVIIR